MFATSCNKYNYITKPLTFLLYSTSTILYIYHVDIHEPISAIRQDYRVRDASGIHLSPNRFRFYMVCPSMNVIIYSLKQVFNNSV